MSVDDPDILINDLKNSVNDPGIYTHNATTVHCEGDPQSIDDNLSTHVGDPS